MSANNKLSVSQLIDVFISLSSKKAFPQKQHVASLLDTIISSDYHCNPSTILTIYDILCEAHLLDVFHATKLLHLCEKSNQGVLSQKFRTIISLLEPQPQTKEQKIDLVSSLISRWNYRSIKFKTTKVLVSLKEQFENSEDPKEKHILYPLVCYLLLNCSMKKVKYYPLHFWVYDSTNYVLISKDNPEIEFTLIQFELALETLTKHGLVIYKEPNEDDPAYTFHLEKLATRG